MTITTSGADQAKSREWETDMEIERKSMVYNLFKTPVLYCGSPITRVRGPAPERLYMKYMKYSLTDPGATCSPSNPPRASANQKRSIYRKWPYQPYG